MVSPDLSPLIEENVECLISRQKLSKNDLRNRSCASPSRPRNPTPIPTSRESSPQKLTSNNVGLRRKGSSTANRSTSPLDKPVPPLPKESAGLLKETEDPFHQPKNTLTSQSSFSMALGRKKSVKTSRTSPIKGAEGESKRGFRGLMARFAGDGSAKKDQASQEIIIRRPTRANQRPMTPNALVTPTQRSQSRAAEKARAKDLTINTLASATSLISSSRDAIEREDHSSTRTSNQERKPSTSTPTSMNGPQFTRRYIQENNLNPDLIKERPKTGKDGSGGMLLSEGGLSPTKQGSFGVAKRVEVNPGMFHVASHQGILEETLRDGARGGANDANKPKLMALEEQNALHLFVPETGAKPGDPEMYSPSLYEGVWERNAKVGQTLPPFSPSLATHLRRSRSELSPNRSLQNSPGDYEMLDSEGPRWGGFGRQDASFRTPITGGIASADPIPNLLSPSSFQQQSAMPSPLALSKRDMSDRSPAKTPFYIDARGLNVQAEHSGKTTDVLMTYQQRIEQIVQAQLLSLMDAIDRKLEDAHSKFAREFIEKIDDIEDRTKNTQNETLSEVRRTCEALQEKIEYIADRNDIFVRETRRAQAGTKDIEGLINTLQAEIQDSMRSIRSLNSTMQSDLRHLSLRFDHLEHWIRNIDNIDVYNQQMDTPSLHGRGHPRPGMRPSVGEPLPSTRYDGGHVGSGQRRRDASERKGRSLGHQGRSNSEEADWLEGPKIGKATTQQNETVRSRLEGEQFLMASAARTLDGGSASSMSPLQTPSYLVQGSSGVLYKPLRS